MTQQQGQGAQPDLLTQIMQKDKANQEKVKFILQLLRNVSMFMVQTFTIPVETILHYRFGERYLSPLQFLVGLFVLGFVPPIVALTVESAGLADRSVIYMPAMTVYFVAFFVHFGLIRLRNKQGVRWHSMSWGLSWPVWSRLPGGQDGWRIIQTYEPAFVVVVGLIIGALGDWFGWYLVLVGVLLITKTAMMYQTQWYKVLDAIDGQIESEDLGAALEGKATARETRGYVVPGALQMSKTLSVTAPDAYARLSPSLQQMIEPKTAAEPETVAD